MRKRVFAALALASATVAATLSILMVLQRDVKDAIPAAHFELPLLHQPEQMFSAKSMLGRTWILNVWASWCSPCVTEHPVISALAKSGRAPIIGVNYMDHPDQAIAWLQRHGNPYRAAVSDADGKIGVDYGIKGVPGTYVIDGQGLIRYRHSGPITPEEMVQKIMPLIQQLKQQ